jgi:hypothetical protein
MYRVSAAAVAASAQSVAISVPHRLCMKDGAAFNVPTLTWFVQYGSLSGCHEIAGTASGDLALTVAAPMWLLMPAKRGLS